MDNLQDFLTLAATVVEYFFFAYLTIAFLVYSLKSPITTKQVKTAPVSQPVVERSLDPTPSFAVMAG